MASDQDRLALRDLLVDRSLVLAPPGEEFTLASGKRSNVYLDGKLTTCFSVAMPLIGRVFLEKIREQAWVPQAVGGLTVGADPIAFSIARESLDRPPHIDAFIVRKAPKSHGRHKFIEGIDWPTNVDVVIIDDVCTGGGSTGQAIEKAQEAGMRVIGVVCLLDRKEGAGEFLKDKFGYQLHSIFTLPELLAYKRQRMPELVGA